MQVDLTKSKMNKNLSTTPKINPAGYGKSKLILFSVDSMHQKHLSKQIKPTYLGEKNEY